MRSNDSSHRLIGRRAIVAGVRSEIGAACARRFAADGAEVLIVDHDIERAEIVRAQIIADGGTAHAFAADVSTNEGPRRVASWVETNWGSVHVLMPCNAAMDYWEEGGDTMEDWEAVLRVNVLAPAFLTRALLPFLAVSGDASVVYLGSVDGVNGNPTYPAYSVSKGGLVPLTHVMASDAGPLGVRVNCIAAAAIVHTGPGDLVPPVAVGSMARVMAVTPLRRAATPADIAGAAAFLASPDAGYITGTVMPVDGGRLAPTPGTDRVAT